MKILGRNISITKASVTKASTPKANQRPLGVPGLSASSGIVNEEFLPALRWPSAGKVYREMSQNDAVVGGCLYMIETLIRKVKWKAVTEDKTPAGEEARAFLESCMFDMCEQTWDDFITEVLSELVYGFSFHEVLYKVRRGPLEKDLKYKSQYTDGKFGWQELPRRSQSSMKEWEFDLNTGKAITFVQDTSGMAGGDKGDIKIPVTGNLLFKTKSDKNNPEGSSLLRRAYRSWYFKKYIEELEGIGIERHLAGIPVLTPDEATPLFDTNNPEMVTLMSWAYSLVAGIRQDKNHGIVLPNGWDLKLLSSSSTGSIDTDAIIRRHDSRIAISMMSDLMLIGTDRSGSFALAGTKQNLFLDSLEAIINSICNTLNTYAVSTLFAINGMNLEILPKVATNKLKEATVSEISVLLRAMNIDVTKSPDLFAFLMNVVGGPEILDPSTVAPALKGAATLAGDTTGSANTNETTKPGTGNSQYEDSADNALK